MKSPSKLHELGRAGLTTQFSAKAVKTMTTESEPVLADDALFQQYWRLVFALVRARSSSMVRFSSGLPGLLAGLLSESPEEVAAAFWLLKELHDAFTVACTRKEKVVLEVPMP